MSSTTVWIFYLVLYALFVAGAWQVFVKAGEDGWKAIIPIWNTLVLLRIVGREWWWILLGLIPIVNIVIWFIVSLDLAKSFGRGVGFAIGTFFIPFIWIPILGFGGDTYKGPGGRTAAAPA